MNSKSLFYRKNEENILDCHLLKFLPSMLSIKEKTCIIQFGNTECLDQFINGNCLTISYTNFVDSWHM